MHRIILLTFFILITLIFKAQGFTLAFGSCIHQEKPLELLDKILIHKPNAFVFLGDNVYADSYDSIRLNTAYQELACNGNFQKLKSDTKIFATWDDHDYGFDDVGKYYPLKEASKRIFMSFFGIPFEDPMRSHEGIYQSKMLKKGGRRIHLILLDNRFFRSDLTRYQKELHGEDSLYFYERLYVPTIAKDSTMLGEAQWKWLEAELDRKASLTIIASSTQFSAAYNGYESWANMPHEREKMLELLQKSKKKHMVFISGDVHYAELSLINEKGRPIYDLTSSGISENWTFSCPNSNRQAGPIMENNFGMIKYFPWKKRIVFEIHDIQGLRLQWQMSLKKLSQNG